MSLCPKSKRPENKVRESLLRNYSTDRRYLRSEAGQKDLANHFELRLKGNRERVIPWIESFIGLCGSRILEIGCGTGSFTLALVERGAKITAIDILPDSIVLRAIAVSHMDTLPNL